jgi:hypothetical protein
MVVGFKCFENVDNELMIHLLHELYFSPHTPLSINVCQLRLVVYLDRISLAVPFAGSDSHYSISPLAYLFP